VTGVPPRAERVSSGEYTREAVARWIDPRRSLGARVVWTVLPVVLVPAALYWIAADRLLARSEREVTALVREEVRAQTRLNLHLDADERLQQIRAQTERVHAVLREAAREASRVLDEGPERGLPAESLGRLAGGVLGFRSPASS